MGLVAWHDLLLTVIWLLTGAGYPWPLWVIGPWGAVMAGRWIVGRTRKAAATAASAGRRARRAAARTRSTVTWRHQG